MLTLPWTAKFKDGTVIQQYEDLNLGEFSSATPVKEHLFQEVLDKKDELELFYLVNQSTDEVFIVDLINGCISKTTNDDEKLEPRADMLRKDQYIYRLIYFREVQKDFNRNLVEIAQNIVYFIGFQYTDENDKNHKRMIKIQEDGKWVVN